jgi:hypothetical protein
MKTTIDMAREAGGFGYVHDAGDEPHKWQFTLTELQAFEALVRADEREACAKVCDDLHPGLATKRAAELIRARGNT